MSAGLTVHVGVEVAIFGGGDVSRIFFVKNGVGKLRCLLLIIGLSNGREAGVEE